MSTNIQRFYYGFQVENIDPDHNGPHFSIYYTTTTDGDTYTTSTEIFEVEPSDSDSLDFFLMKEPSVVQLKDKSYLMFYLTGFKCEDGTSEPDYEYNCP